MSTGGQALGGLVGGIAGFFLGGPTGALYGAQIGLGIGGYIDPPKGPTVEGPRLSDLTVQTSTYGAVIPRVYGTVTVIGNVFWLENNALKEVVTKKKSGGKGGGSKTTTRTYTYFATFAVGLDDTRAKGVPIAGVRRIWIGPDLWYDAGSSDPDTIAASNAASAGFSVYLGTDTQSPDARMQATLGVANTPAYRGLAYIVFYDLPLAKYGNSLLGAQVKVEVFAIGVYSYSASGYSLPSSKYWNLAASSADHVMVVAGGLAQNDFAVSTDGITWSPGTLPRATSYYTIAYGAGKFLVPCPSYLETYYSVDNGANWITLTTISGTNWTTNPTNNYMPYSGSGYDCMCWDGVMFVAISSNGTVARSVDGISWTKGVINSRGWSSVASNGAVLCAVAGSTNICAVSVDHGLTWVEHTMASTVAWHSIASDGSRFVAGGWGVSVCNVSSDNGLTWQAYGGFGINCSQIAWNGNAFCALDYSASGALVSPDGQTWTLLSMPTVPNWRALCAFLGNFVAVRENSSASAIVYAQASGASDTLSSIVSSECLQSNLLSSGDIDVTALVSEVRGYRVGSVGSIRSALEPLRASWPFDVAQRGYKVVFVARGGSSIATIAAADLDARQDGTAPGVQITTGREMDSQLPRRVAIQHLDYDREYDAGTQYAERLNTAAIHLVAHDLPIVLTATEAAGKAEVLLYLAWLERYDVAINLPPTYNQLEPGDVVTLVTPDGNVSLRLTAITYTADGRVECTAKYANPAIYTPTAVGAAGQSIGTATIPRVGPSLYTLLDIPLVHDAQASPGFPVAMCGTLAGWNGGVLMQSTDAGATWSAIEDFGPPGAAIGQASNSIGAVESRMIDKASRLTVILTSGDLYDTTELAMLGGANHFAYGVDGRWEIIAAQKCTLQSGTTYILSDLMRGRYGTEQYMGTHATGDSVVLLDVDDLAIVAMSSNTIGLARDYRGITLDQDIGSDSSRTFTYAAINLKPLAPIALTGNRDPASNDWALAWVRRTRSGGEWRDYVEADLAESAEQYQIDIFADGSYATVKRTLWVGGPSASYLSADQVTDFGSNQATLYLKIYQMSATVGRGYPLTTSITR